MEREAERESDRCAYFHESVRMYCGAVRRTHASRYVDHEFVEGLVDTLLTTPKSDLARAIAKARGNILTDNDMKANIDFLNKAAQKIKEQS